MVMRDTVSRIGLSAVFIGSLLSSWVLPGRALAEESSPFEVNPFERLPLPTEELDEEHRRSWAADLADQGRRDLSSFEYDQAARRLEASYRMVPAPEVLQPLAEALRQLNHFAAAAERLRTYLDTTPNVDAETQAELERQIQLLQGQYARVTVTTSPEGATISLDDQELGMTPLDPFVLNHGHYRLLARLEGYRDEEQGLAVAGGRPVEVSLHLVQLHHGASRRGLRIALWVNVALSVVGAVALTVTALSAAHLDDCSGNDPDCSLASRQAVSDDFDLLSNATWGLTAVTGATGIAALVLGLIQAL